VAESEQLTTFGSRDETAEPSSRDVLEENPLDRILRAESKNLVPLRSDELLGQAQDTLETVPYVQPASNP
jgi:hypothetical protein